MVLMTRLSPGASFESRSAALPSISTSSDGALRNRMRGGSFFTGNAFCFDCACAMARLACSACADSGHSDFVTEPRRVARYLSASSWLAPGKLLLVMRTELSVTRSVDLSIWVRALSSITP